MKLRAAIVVGACLVASQAYAAYIDKFIGWSKDGTYFAKLREGTDTVDWPTLCLSARERPSPTWPKDVPQPDKDDDEGCTGTWGMEVFADSDPQKLVDKATALVEKPRGKPLHGETVDVRKAGDGSLAEVVVSRGGKPIARGFIALRRKSEVPDTVTAYWRADGLAVAVEAGFAPAAEAGPGFGPPQYLVVLALDGSTANAKRPKTPREQARDLNIEGMKLLGASQLAAAEQKFVEATQADDTFALAYYNLASAASLAHHANTAIGAIGHVIALASSDADAKRAIAKAKTDHDLDFIAAESPYVAHLLGRPTTKADEWCIAVEKRARDINLVNWEGVAHDIAIALDASAAAHPMAGNLVTDPSFTCAATAKGSQLTIGFRVKWTAKTGREVQMNVAWEQFPDGFFDADALGDDNKPISVKKVDRVVKASRDIAGGKH